MSRTEILVEAVHHLGAESPRALMDLSLRLHWLLPERGGVPTFVHEASLGVQAMQRVVVPSSQMPTLPPPRSPEFAARVRPTP